MQRIRAGGAPVKDRRPAPSASFQYDADGELTQQTTEDATTSFTWDAAGRLAGRSGKEDRTNYAYTGDGDLVRETRSGEDADDAPKTLQYTLDTAGPLSQVLVASSGKDATTFLYGLKRIAALGRDTRYYGADVRGSVRTTTNERGQVKRAASYDAWGVPKDEGEGSDKFASLFGFTGERQDPSGLAYLRARWYDPSLGRFLSPDPARGHPTDPRTLSPLRLRHGRPHQPRRPNWPHRQRSGRRLAQLCGGHDGVLHGSGDHVAGVRALRAHRR